MLTESWVEGKSVEKKMHNQPRERLGYLGNPRSLKEGTETYVGLTDE